MHTEDDIVYSGCLIKILSKYHSHNVSNVSKEASGVAWKGLQVGLGKAGREKVMVLLELKDPPEGFSMSCPEPVHAIDGSIVILRSNFFKKISPRDNFCSPTTF